MYMYQNYSDAEIIAAYKDMMDFSGKPSKDMEEAIAQRGGMEAFEKKIAWHQQYKTEAARVTKEIHSLTVSGMDADFIKKLIRSTFLSKPELDALIERKFADRQAEISNNEITKSSVWGALIGIIAGIFLIGFFIHFFEFDLYTLIVLAVPIYLLNYFIIYIITKQSRRNVVVFIACFIATAGSSLLGLYWPFDF